jgi:hypothetical protein
MKTLPQLTKQAVERAENPNEAAEIAAAARRKEAREDRAYHYAIVSANATDKTVSFARSYRVGDESRTIRERVAPASRLNGRELLSRCQEAVRLGSARLEAKGMRISDEDRLDAAAELCARTLDASAGALPKRDADKLGKTYMRERAAGIILDVFRKRQHEDLTDDFDLATATERAESRAADNAPDPYLADAEGDPAAAYLRVAARTLDPWPHSAIEAAIVHSCMPAVPSEQWAAHEDVKPSTWRSRCQKGREQLAELEPDDIRAAMQDAERGEEIVSNIDDELNATTIDQEERERADLERLLSSRPSR